MNAASSGAAAKAEWRGYWFLPFIAGLGYSAAVLPVYVIGPFMEPLNQAFGWTRAEMSLGSTIVNFCGALTTPFIGALVDRLGPRRIALVGVPMMGAAMALLSTVTGSMTNWILLWVIVAVSGFGLQPSVWTSAVVSRFKAARGLALAVTLSGGSFSAAVLPLLTTWLIAAFGWRMGFVGVGLIWTAVLFPLVIFFFRGVQDSGLEARRASRAATAALPGLTLKEAVRKPAFYKLTIAGGFFSFCIVGAAVHFVPILVGAGASPVTAASAASLVGVFAIIGRLSAGVFLDRFPGHIVGAAAFLIPLAGCAILLTGATGGAGQFVAAATFGLTLGAEIDLIAYLATRHFGLRNFGVILGALLSLVAIGAGIGPLAAGATFDAFGGYMPFIVLTSVLMCFGAVLMATLGRGPEMLEARPVEASQA